MSAKANVRRQYIDDRYAESVNGPIQELQANLRCGAVTPLRYRLRLGWP